MTVFGAFSLVAPAYSIEFQGWAKTDSLKRGIARRRKEFINAQELGVFIFRQGQSA